MNLNIKTFPIHKPNYVMAKNGKFMCSTFFFFFLIWQKCHWCRSLSFRTFSTLFFELTFMRPGQVWVGGQRRQAPNESCSPCQASLLTIHIPGIFTPWRHQCQGHYSWDWFPLKTPQTGFWLSEIQRKIVPLRFSLLVFWASGKGSDDLCV